MRIHPNADLSTERKLASSAFVTTQQTSSGPRYVVRFRLEGRADPIQHGGSFKTLREARARRDVVAGELSRTEPRRRFPGRDGGALTRTFSEWAKTWKESRVDDAPATLEGDQKHLLQDRADLREARRGDDHPSNVQERIGANADLAPASLSKDLATRGPCSTSPASTETTPPAIPAFACPGSRRPWSSRLAPSRSPRSSPTFLLVGAFLSAPLSRPA